MIVKLLTSWCDLNEATNTAGTVETFWGFDHLGMLRKNTREFIISSISSNYLKRSSCRLSGPLSPSGKYRKRLESHVITDLGISNQYKESGKLDSYMSESKSYVPAS